MPLKRVLILFLALLFSSAAFAQERWIHLKNETIRPDPTMRTKSTLAFSTEPTTGLYLIQFIRTVEPDWRATLNSMSVDLVKYVPDDAFIAHLGSARLGEIAALPYVRYVGPYKPEHKIHHSLARSGSQEIRVLLSPLATGPERLEASRLSRGFHSAKSPIGTILQGAASPQQLAALARSQAVLWIEPNRKPKLLDEIATKLVAGDNGVPGTEAVVQLLGFDGSGVVVAVPDTGLNNGTAAGMHPDLFGRVDKFMWYGSLTDASDGFGHGTHVAGIVAANAATGETDSNGYLYGLGVAPKAHLVIQRIFDNAGGYQAPPSDAVLTQDAVRSGAVISSDSWGNDVQGEYDIDASQFDGLVRDADPGTPGDQPYIMEFSAGNAGPSAQTLDSPASGKNVIATGASENNRTDMFIYADGPQFMADFSSRGPCEDGRLKPDLVAPGTWISSLQSASATADNSWEGIDQYYQFEGGTSQAGPHASGAAAVFVQYYRQTHTNATPSPALVKAALINSATDITVASQGETAPNNDEGWGLLTISNLIGSPIGHEFIDQTTPLTNGQVFVHTLVVADSGQPLTITLVYTDVPGFPGSIPALVNDLNLEVIGPDGQDYHGNQILNGASVPGVAAFDALNNVEGVILPTPLPGEYTIRVIAANVVADARQDTPQVDQDFALVSSGDLPGAGAAVVFLNKTAYMVPDRILATVIDPKEAGQSSVSVLLTSLSDPEGVTLGLLAEGNNGVFTGSVATARGPAVPPVPTLLVTNQDLIQCVYQDGTQKRTATALADLFPPVISGVSSTNQFGQVTIQWLTDEPATTALFYGANGSLALSFSSQLQVTNHAVTLGNVSTGLVYQYEIVAQDAAGNVSTNNNDGKFFTFIPTPVAAILLVNAYTYDPANEPPEPDQPLSTYTDSLDQIGVSYDVWEAETSGAPSLKNLAPYKLVIWRINDSVWEEVGGDPNITLSPGEQNDLTTYINGGGTFFMTSAEILSRITDGGPPNAFFTNVLHISNYNADVGVEEALGVSQDPIGAGMDLVLNYAAYDDMIGDPPDTSDTMTVAPEASAVFLDQASGQTAGVRYPKVGADSPGRVVFFSFPFDTIPAAGTSPNTRLDVMRRVVSFLIPGAGGLDTVTLDRGAYTLPSQITVEVADAAQTGTGKVQAVFSSQTATNSQALALGETTRPGLFRGYISLVSAANPAKPGVLRANGGDQISVVYANPATKQTAQAGASVDTNAPAISLVTSQPNYLDAIITWNTTKAADSQVQFGQSTFLGRTSYDPNLLQSHSLDVTGLTADRIYYYEVVSRDEAGNVAIDDNGGRFYSFVTLSPILPPWFDNLESGATNWSEATDPSSEVQWQLGTPANGYVKAAHSGTNAWCSNITGGAIDTVSSTIATPAVLLAGGDTATLTFWQAYSFPTFASDVLEDAEVDVSTDLGNTWTTLNTYTGDSGGWVLETIDLTPYMGQNVLIGWSYTLISEETDPRPGWAIDDVGISVTYSQRDVQVTNNLSQASFTLASTTNVLRGSGQLSSFTNIPPGQYVLTFAPVPYYIAPPPQTNMFVTNGFTLLTGLYTFPDANHNGISDLWETHYFGTVSTNRTMRTDTDGDGFTDYAEFIAGTDPTDPKSYLAVRAPEILPNHSMILSWDSVPGRSYQFWSSPDLFNWTPSGGWIQATTTNMAVTNLAAPGFFRVQVTP
jgi:serine protease AprX